MVISGPFSLRGASASPALWPDPPHYAAFRGLPVFWPLP